MSVWRRTAGSGMGQLRQSRLHVERDKRDRIPNHADDFAVSVGCSSQEQEKQSNTVRRVICSGIYVRVELSLICYAVDAVEALRYPITMHV